MDKAFDKDKYICELAVYDDVDNILKLILSRITWMDENSIEQWNKTNYLECYPEEYFIDCISKNELYILRYKSNKNIVGSVVLHSHDKRWDDNDKSYYIHNLVTDINAVNAGSSLIKYCEEIAKKNGKDYLRLDCQYSNTKLNKYYENIGFKFVSIIKDELYIGNKREKYLK